MSNSEDLKRKQAEERVKQEEQIRKREEFAKKQQDEERKRRLNEGGTNKGRPTGLRPGEDD
ncbi:hypothetical protein OQY15_18260 [Pedobacter sp. MC2016-15]|uniref:hypothetical protein n=1 Tax=Pedobacter sp. MC2016-15 TaxID=2994473 RepID=UPI002247419E|nr:hypothetical protein [Pedobacter sp. MC2016-15]MCX2481054.1 hypothetical protein [Pedobacter sp. MC2016-15]